MELGIGIFGDLHINEKARYNLYGKGSLPAGVSQKVYNKNISSFTKTPLGHNRRWSETRHPNDLRTSVKPHVKNPIPLVITTGTHYGRILCNFLLINNQNMNIYRLGIATVLTISAITSFTQAPQYIDLRKMFKDGNIVVYNRSINLINEEGHKGIGLSKDFGEGIAWLKGIEFSNGIIEFDVRGENIKQHSFVGIAFHGKNDSTFDAVYLRPFQFLEDEPLKSRAIQYISLPNYTWQILREKAPGKYEHSIDPAPDPDSWVRVRIVINGATVKVYINGSPEPSLVVEKVTNIKSGSVGFYVADTSGGDFANLTIIKNN
jgi:hypothetical protein